MNDYSSRIIPEKFVCEKYQFQLFGDALTEISYKVTPLTYKKVDPEKFYNDIMNSEEINFYLGIILGFIIVDKKAYINIIEESKSYNMILSLKILNMTDYYDSILNISTTRNIRNEFFDTILDKFKYPVSISVDEFSINDNPFCNTFYTSINIFNVNDENVADIIDNLYSKIIKDINITLSSYINKSRMFNISFIHKFIIIHGYRSIKIVGFIIPNMIENIKILSISKKSVILEESDDWMNGTFNVADLIPYIYNKENLLYNTSKIVNEEIKIIDGKRYYKINFNTSLFILNGVNQSFESVNIDDDILYNDFIPYFSIDNNFIIYENITENPENLYCGYIHNNDNDISLFEYVKNNKNFKNIKIHFFYKDLFRTYFIMKSNKNSFKSIFDSIKKKLKMR